MMLDHFMAVLRPVRLGKPVENGVRPPTLMRGDGHRRCMTNSGPKNCLPRALRGENSELDPKGIMNPGVLIDRD